VSALRRRTGLELFRVLRGDLGNFEQANLSFVINQSSTLFGRPFSVIHKQIRAIGGANLDIGLGLVRDLHEEFSFSIDHVLEDPLIDTDREGKVNRRQPVSLFVTYTAPRLSEFETNRYSFPSAIN
jgi:hypothetical protein